MPLPSVNIELQNGQLGGTANTADGVAALIVTGIAVTAAGAVLGVVLNTPYQIFSLADAEERGLTEAYDTTNSVEAYKQIKDFYAQAPTGAELWIMVVANTVTLAQMVDKTVNTYARAILNAAGGRVKLLAITRNPASGYTPTITDGMDGDCVTAVANMQALAEDYADQNRPFRGLVQIRSGVLADLKNWAATTNNAVGCVIGATATGNNAAVGLVLGKLAAVPVQRSIARVKDGDLGILTAFIANVGNVLAQNNTVLDTLHDKGYIFFRVIEGLGGFYISNDNTATGATDDYKFLSLGRVIDKARVLAYTAMVQELNDDVEVTADGKITAGVGKALQAAVERTLNTNMVNNSEISSVSAYVDLNQNILATSTTEVVVGIVPKGTHRTINIKLGYVNSANA